MNADGKRCPDEIAQILSEIITNSVLAIRMAAWNGNADFCASEADHIHNLPGLISHYSNDCLKYYLEVEVPCYVSRRDDQYTSSQKKLWEQLQYELQRQLDKK